MEDFNRPLCPHMEFCGGCLFQGIPYEAQLAEKEATVHKLMEDKGVTSDRVDKIEGCPGQYEYRNKMEYTFGDFSKGGEMTLGMHRKKNFMSIVTVDHCQLVDPNFNMILRYTLDFANEKGYSFYNKKSHEGVMRNLIVRKGMRTDELLINVVTSSQTEFDEEDFAAGLLDLKLSGSNRIVGILRTVNDNVADAVNCDSLRVLYGRDYYMEKILNLDFKVSAFSFFQTNVEAVERLYTEALALIDSFEGKRVFDLYCGTGTISQILALKAKEVLGVEIVEDAVASARENAKLNGLENCNFIAGDVFEVLSGLDEGELPDVIVVDPPRVGIHPKALEKILNYGVNEIVYVSCNPKSLMDNVKFAEHYGYKCSYLKPFDNFPMTGHVETVVLMSRKAEKGLK